MFWKLFGCCRRRPRSKVNYPGSPLTRDKDSLLPFEERSEQSQPITQSSSFSYKWYKLARDLRCDKSSWQTQAFFIGIMWLFKTLKTSSVAMLINAIVERFILFNGHDQFTAEELWDHQGYAILTGTSFTAASLGLYFFDYAKLNPLRHTDNLLETLEVVVFMKLLDIVIERQRNQSPSKAEFSTMVGVGAFLALLRNITPSGKWRQGQAVGHKQPFIEEDEHDAAITPLESSISNYRTQHSLCRKIFSYFMRGFHTFIPPYMVGVSTFECVNFLGFFTEFNWFTEKELVDDISFPLGVAAASLTLFTRVYDLKIAQSKTLHALMYDPLFKIALWSSVAEAFLLSAFQASLGLGQTTALINYKLTGQTSINFNVLFKEFPKPEFGEAVAFHASYIFLALMASFYDHYYAFQDNYLAQDGFNIASHNLASESLDRSWKDAWDLHFRRPFQDKPYVVNADRQWGETNDLEKEDDTELIERCLEQACSQTDSNHYKSNDGKKSRDNSSNYAYSDYEFYKKHRLNETRANQEEGAILANKR